MGKDKGYLIDQTPKRRCFFMKSGSKKFVGIEKEFTLSLVNNLSLVLN